MVDIKTTHEIEWTKRHLGKQIRLWRVWRCYSTRELAQKADINHVHLVRLEDGEYMPTAKTIRKIADALEIEPHVLMTEEPPNNLISKMASALAKPQKRRNKQPSEPTTADESSSTGQESSVDSK